MTKPDIVRNRLTNQQIVSTEFNSPQQIVTWMGAMQAQIFPMAKWAIGLRLRGFVDKDIEQAFTDGLILRTHVLRPTWHFVTPADIRWMLALTAPRVHAISSFMYRQLELEPKVFKRSNDILVKTLRGGKQLTRSALKPALEKAKIKADGLRLGYLMMYAELEGVICSGAKQGKQFTYALLEERVPSTRKLNREEALATLASRYFASRGPATLRDFVWWSGLTVKDARAGIAMLNPDFEHAIIDGKDYISKPLPSKNSRALKGQTTFLMPDYDEYGIGYKDRTALYNPKLGTGGNTYSHWIVIDGCIGGTWQATLKKNTVIVETTFFSSLNKSKDQAVKKAVRRYHSFFR